VSLEIHLLGVPLVKRNGAAVPAPRGRKVWALLAYLIRTPTGANRHHLARLLFEDAEDPLAALRWNLSELRRLLGLTGLRGAVLRLTLEPTAYVDAEVLASGSWPQALSVPGLDQELLAGMHFADCPSFEVWLSTERRHLQATAEAVLREAAQARLAAGASRDAADLAGRLVLQNPLDENYQVLLVRSLAAAGDGVGASRQVAACRELFLRELGVAPGLALEDAMRTVTDIPTARPATGRSAATAQLDAGEAAIGAGALEPGLQCLRRAILEADTTGDPVLRARTRVALGGALVHAARGRDEEGATALHEAIAVASHDAPQLAAAAARELGYIEFLRGRYERATVWLRQASDLATDDRAEQTRIAIVRGSVLSDTAHYSQAIETLRSAVEMAEQIDDPKQLAYALSMLGRAHLLRREFEVATLALDRSVAMAQRGWTAFLPWPQALRAEIDLDRGHVDLAADRFEHAFALGCQLGDPCWEGIAGRGLGRVAIARDHPQRGVEILVDSIARSIRWPDAYLWGKAYLLDVLCELAVVQRLPQALGWIGELQGLAARSGMRELTVRSHAHRAALGDRASAAAAAVLASEIDNPSLHGRLEAPA